MLAKLKHVIADITARLEKLERVRAVPKDGEPGERGADGPTGATGSSVTDVRVEDNLVFVAIDGVEREAGVIETIQGETGADGEKGERGPKGEPGRDAVAPSVEEIVSQIPEPARGPKGEQGERGRKGDRGDRGPKGEPGRDGQSVPDVELRNNDLFVQIDGKKKKAGTIKLPAATAPFNPGNAGGGGSARQTPALRTVFKSVQDRDDYFERAVNYQRLATDDPIIVNIGNDTIASYLWDGPNNPDSYQPDFWIQSSIQLSPASTNVGSRRDSNGGEAAQWKNTATGEEFIYVDDPVPADPLQESGVLTRDYLMPLETFNNQIVASNVVSTPDPDGVTRYVLLNQASGRNESFSAIPAEAGDFTLELRLGSFAMEPIFRQRVTFTETDAKVRTVTNITQAANAVITFDEPHEYSIGDSAVLDQVVGMVEINNLPNDVIGVSATTITVSTDTTLFTPYVSGGVGYTEIFTDLDNPLTLRSINAAIFTSLVPAPGQTMSFRGGDFGPSFPFIPYLRAKSRPIEEVAIIDEKNKPVVQYINELPASTTNSDYSSAPVAFLDQDFEIREDKAGVHQVTFSFGCSVNVTDRRVVVGLFIDNVLIDEEFAMEMKDVNNRPLPCKIFDYDFTPGTHNVRVDFGREGGGGGSSVTLKNARISVRSE